MTQTPDSSEKGRELLREMGVPEGYKHIMTVVLGYMDGERPAPKPRKKEVINYIK